MPKVSLGHCALILVLLIYAISLGWFLYVGPITTHRVAKAVRLQQQRVVISLTTTPYRIDKIQATLDSLLAQSIPAAKIYLNIPYKLHRDNVDYVLPAWLQSYPGITIQRTQDFGPITKLIPTLQQENDPDTIIITVDDDVVYPRHVLRDLVDYAVQHPQVVVTPLNVQFTVGADYVLHITDHKFKHAAKTNLIVGAAGVAYRRGFFDSTFADYFATLPEQCFLCDDLVLSMFLAHQHIDIHQTIKNSLHPLVVPFAYQEQLYKSSQDALSFSSTTLSGNQIRYASCLRHLQGSAYRQSFLARNILSTMLK